MALPKYYNTGTASVSNGSTSVTGTGTAWLNLITAGDVFRRGGYSVRVASVESNGALTLAEGWPGTTLTNSAYEIALVFDGPEFQLRTRQLLEQLNVLETSGRGIVLTYDEATTDSDPGDGNFKLNGLPAVATRLYIDNLDIEGADISAEIDTWDDSANTTRGRLWMRSIDVPATFYSYDVTGSIADGTGYRKVTLTYVGGSGTLADGDEVTFFFTPHGEKGDGLDWDARTATLAGLLDYENQAVGYRVLVDDNGNGRSAVYELENSGSPTDWSDPIYVSGEAATITVGTVTTLAAGASATVTNSGNSQDAVLNFGIPQGSGLDFDVQVDTLAGLLDYENQAVGYRVLVSDVGDGRAAVYILENSGSPTEWSDPSYVTGDSGTTPSYVTGDSGTTVVATRAAMKALNTTSVDVAYLTESGREGIFVWRAGDYSTQIAADTQEGIYIKADGIAATVGAWVRVFSGPASVKWFGARGDNSTADLAALQAATDLVDAVFIPNGIYKTSGPWLLDDSAVLYFESREAEISSTSATDIIRPRGYTTTRNFDIEIHSGTLRGNGAGTCNGINFMSTSMANVWGTWITACNVAILNGGTGSQGAFYNRFFGVDITTCTVGYRNGTLGNEIQVFGGRITDVVVGTDDDDNSGVLYSGVAIETFTNSGHRMSNSGSACSNVRSIGCRFENPSLIAPYDTAVAIRIAAATLDAYIAAHAIITVATGLSNAGTRTQLAGARRNVVNQAVASLAAGATRQDAFTIAGVAAGDCVSVTLPVNWPAGLVASAPISSSGQVYLQLYNPTGAAISMAADNFYFEVKDFT